MVVLLEHFNFEIIDHQKSGMELYSVSHHDMRGISICMFGNVGQTFYVKLYRLSLFIVTYIIPAVTVTAQAVTISRYLQKQPLGYTEKSQRRRIRVSDIHYFFSYENGMVVFNVKDGILGNKTHFKMS